MVDLQKETASPLLHLIGLSISSSEVKGCTCHMSHTLIIDHRHLDYPQRQNMVKSRYVCTTPTIIEFTNTFIIQSTSISCLAGDKRLHYNLVGVVAHMKLFGDCGHYTSMVKSQHSNVTVNWVHMDDGQVLKQYTAEPLIKDPLRKGQPLCNRTNRFVQPLYTGQNSQRVLYSEVPHCSVTTPIMAI